MVIGLSCSEKLNYLYSDKRYRGKEGQGGMRVRCFSCCKGEKRRGLWYGRVVCSLALALVALDSLVRGSRGHSGACAAHFSLVKRKDKTTHVCLERAVF